MNFSFDRLSTLVTTQVSRFRRRFGFWFQKSVTKWAWLFNNLGNRIPDDGQIIPIAVVELARFSDKELPY